MFFSRRSFLTIAASVVATTVVSARRARAGSFGRQLEAGLEPIIGQTIENVMVGMLVGVLVALPILLVAVLIDTFSKTLKLNRQQISEWDRLGNEALEEVKRFAALTAHERKSTFESFVKALEEKYLPKLLLNLSSEQLLRFREIRLQLLGPVGLMDAGVASELNLNEQQKNLIAQMVHKLKAIKPVTDDDRSFARRASGALMSRKLAELRAKAVLTDEQRRKFTELQGEQIRVEELLRQIVAR